MAVLNSWQKLTRVLPGKPFGDGVDGDYSSGTIPTMTYRSCSGSAGSTTLTLGSSGFSNGDVILIHQTRGTGVGQWEINRIVSGGGTTSLTLQTSLYYTYTDSGASQAQAIKIPRYNNVTCSGTWNVTSWNQDTGGIFVIAARKTFTINSGGGINANGNNGSISGGGIVSGGIGVGYRGGSANVGSGVTSYQGEGTADGTTNGGYQNQNNNGSGGGGNIASSSEARGGGGGGNANNGGNGTVTPGYGGSSAGTSDLINIVFGGGGGGGAAWNTGGNQAGSGGAGGGIVIIMSNIITLNGSINLTGGNGGDGWCDGGGGAGGSLLLITKNSALGSSLIQATGGVGGGTGTGLKAGGDGSVGRIAIHYSGSISGSTNPSYYGQLDPTLKEVLGGSFLYNFV